MPLPERTEKNSKVELKTDRHGFTKLEAHWPNGTSWRTADYGQARLEATLQRDGSIWMVLAEVPSNCKGTKEIMVTLPADVVAKLKELSESKRP